MSKIIGVKSLTDYLQETPLKLSRSTIYRMVRMHHIPYSRPTPGIILFDTDRIDAWINGEEVAK